MPRRSDTANALKSWTVTFTKVGNMSANIVVTVSAGDQGRAIESARQEILRCANQGSGAITAT